MIMGKDIFGNPTGNDVHGNAGDKDAFGNRPADGQGKAPKDIYGNNTGGDNTATEEKPN